MVNVVDELCVVVWREHGVGELGLEVDVVGGPFVLVVEPVEGCLGPGVLLGGHGLSCGPVGVDKELRALGQDRSSLGLGGAWVLGQVLEHLLVRHRSDSALEGPLAVGDDLDPRGPLRVLEPLRVAEFVLLEEPLVAEPTCVWSVVCRSGS